VVLDFLKKAGSHLFHASFYRPYLFWASGQIMRSFTAAITFTGLLLSAEAATITEDARCGPYGKGQTCLNSIWGSCCSQYGWW
jgi:hypothetical protein